MTFGATLNAVINAGLIPIICPIREDDFSIDLSKISSELLEKTAAVCVVHLYGSGSNIADIIKLKEKYNFYVARRLCRSFGF